MKLRARGLIAFVLLLASAMGQLPSESLTVSGVLSDGSGTPLAVSANLRFFLYDMAAGGTLLWTESHGGVPLEHGGRRRGTWLHGGRRCEARARGLGAHRTKVALRGPEDAPPAAGQPTRVRAAPCTCGGVPCGRAGPTSRA